MLVRNLQITILTPLLGYKVYAKGSTSTSVLGYTYSGMSNYSLGGLGKKVR